MSLKEDKRKMEITYHAERSYLKSKHDHLLTDDIIANGNTSRLKMHRECRMIHANGL